MILFYFGSDSVDFGERQVLEAMRHLRERECPFRALVSDRSSAIYQELTRMGYPCDTLCRPALFGWAGRHLFFEPLLPEVYRYTRKLLRYYDMHDFKGVHSIGFSAHLFTIALKVRFGTLLFWQVCEVPSRWLGRMLFRHAIAIFCDGFFVSSSQVLDWLGRSVTWRHKFRDYRPEEIGKGLERLHLSGKSPRKAA